MVLLREHTATEYWADHSVLVLRDQGGGDYEVEELLGESATGAQPGGTIATAGAGWLWANASGQDADHEVRLEAHDSEPPDDAADWDDVMETPYLSPGGSVAPAALLGGDYEEHTLTLGPPGRYRVRVSCRRQAGRPPTDETPPGDTWRLQFWPAAGDREPPCWLARSVPAVTEWEPEWASDFALDRAVRSVLDAARIVAGDQPGAMSAAQIAAARAADINGDDVRPEAGLWPPLPPPPLTSGHPDTDAFEAGLHAELVAEQAERERDVAALAARFTLPPPVTVADVLALFVRIGLLTAEGEGEVRYSLPAELPSLRDVLDLPVEKAEESDRQESFYELAAPAADLVFVALWTETGRVGTIADLAGRLLEPPEDVRAVLRYAEREELLRVEGDLADAGSQLTLTPLPRREDEYAGEPIAIPVPGSLELAEGGPPRAGIVTESGDLVVWRSSGPEVLASLSGEVLRAIDTPYGIAVFELAQVVLVRPDREPEVLAADPDPRVALSADGRYLALSTSSWGRRPKSTVLVFDLADGSSQSLQLRGTASIAGLYDGAVYVAGDDGSGVRWTPGRDPEPLPWPPRTVDPLTGAVLIEGQAEGLDGWLVVGQDGERHHVRVTSNADLALGGTHLIDFRYQPPAVTLFDVARGGADPRIWWLPEASDTSVPGSPAWEDAGHLLFRRPYRDDPPAVRLDVRTGAVEGVTVPGLDDNDLYSRFTFVESPR